MAGGGRFKCPACRQRVQIRIVGGGWVWATHNRKDGQPCSLSGKQMA